MPEIPVYQRKQSIPGETGEVFQNVQAAGTVGQAGVHFGNAIQDLGSVLMHRAAVLERQKEDNRLIEEGARINEDVIQFRTNFEKENKGINASGSMAKIQEFLDILGKNYGQEGSDRYKGLIKQHIAAQGNVLRGHLSTYEAAQLKDYAGDVRALDLESSLKMAQTGDYNVATVNYQKTLDAQKANGSLSDNDYAIEMLKGKSALASSYIMSLNQTDPVSAKTALESLKPTLTADAVVHLENLIKPSVTRQKGNAVGTEVFKNDTTGSLEQMTDAVRAKGLDPDTEKHAVDQIKELYHERTVDVQRQQRDAIDKVNAVLVPLALQRNGINKTSDLSPAQWAELTQKAPEYAQKLQDNIRRENDYLIRQAKADTREARAEARMEQQERRIQQAEKESEIIASEDFATRDLKRDVATGAISATQYAKLKTMQDKMDPIKRSSVVDALKKINSGSALSVALGGVDKNDEAQWKMKYGDLVKAFAYNNANDPNFDTKLSDFVENKILSDMVTSWFATDATDRLTKYNEAKKIAGEIPQRKATDKQVPSPANSFDEANMKNQERWITEHEADITKKLKGKPAGTYRFPGNNIPVKWDGNGGFTISIPGRQ